jgi:hypothetical protein
MFLIFLSLLGRSTWSIFKIKEGYSDTPAVPVGKRLLMTLWYLGTQADFRSLGALLGVRKSTVCDIVHEACRIMRQVLIKTFVKFPRNQTVLDVVNVSFFYFKYGPSTSSK